MCFCETPPLLSSAFSWFPTDVSVVPSCCLIHCQSPPISVMHFYVYVYVYIYMCVCACACVCVCMCVDSSGVCVSCVLCKDGLCHPWLTHSLWRWMLWFESRCPWRLMCSVFLLFFLHGCPCCAETSDSDVDGEGMEIDDGAPSGSGVSSQKSLLLFLSFAGFPVHCCCGRLACWMLSLSLSLSTHTPIRTLLHFGAQEIGKRTEFGSRCQNPRGGHA